jgi:2-polyprenyl-3-methyl-5-hydroxy-6-metoxy-1,4-benzoquinol methylase
VFSKRLIRPELMDHLPPGEARGVLADLVRINARFGGHSVLRKTLASLVGQSDRFTLLDVGSASGDTARDIQRSYPGAAITSLDYNASNLEAAPYPKVLGDAFRLPFLPGSFDYVLCSLFLHHFEDARVVELLQSFYSTARRAVVVCDLERHVLPYLFLPVTKTLFGWQRVTVHDGIISVRASFRREELLALCGRAGIGCAQVRVHRPAFRISLIARKEE